jgi:steroid 5-alpha reductase family enzyme
VHTMYTNQPPSCTIPRSVWRWGSHPQHFAEGAVQHCLAVVGIYFKEASSVADAQLLGCLLCLHIQGHGVHLEAG